MRVDALLAVLYYTTKRSLKYMLTKSNLSSSRTSLLLLLLEIMFRLPSLPTVNVMILAGFGVMALAMHHRIPSSCRSVKCRRPLANGSNVFFFLITTIRSALMAVLLDEPSLSSKLGNISQTSNSNKDKSGKDFGSE